MGIIEDERSSALVSGVRAGRTNKTRSLRSRSEYESFRPSVKRSPEVLVKISGFTKGGFHLKAHMSYVSRKGNINIEDEEGSIFRDLDSIQSMAKAWQREIDEGNPPKTNRRDAVRMVLSMPPGTDPMALKKAVRQFAKETFDNHAYVFALHTDEKHPHVHLTVQMRGFDGERLNPRKKDLQNWREALAACLLDEGVDCVATPRASRTRGYERERTTSKSKVEEQTSVL